MLVGIHPPPIGRWADQGSDDMKVLVATHQTQGTVSGDYCYTVDGELVTPLVVECAEPDECGCGRGFPGLASGRATTTAVVADLAHLDRAGLSVALRDSLERGGWLAGLTAAEIDDEVRDHVETIEWTCMGRPVGTIVRRNGAELRIDRAA